jgi:DNA-binding transcriptional LysR family regulator
MIEQGLGVAVLPGYLVRGSARSDSLVSRRLEDPLVERSLLVHTRQGHVLSAPASRFLELLRTRLEQ